MKKIVVLALLLSGCTVLVPRGTTIEAANTQAQFCRAVYPVQSVSGLAGPIIWIEGLVDRLNFIDCLSQFGIK